MGKVASLYGVDYTGPHQPRCSIVQLEAQDHLCIVNYCTQQEAGLFKQNAADLEK
jgi:hypothetical protein